MQGDIIIKIVGHTTTILRIDSMSMELARVIARASTTIPTRFWSVGSESVASGVAVTSMGASEDSGQGEGDDERAEFFPAFLGGLEADRSSALVLVGGSVEAASTLDFLEARMSTPPIDRRFTEVLTGSQVASTSVKSDSGVDCLVSSSRTGEEERHVKGEERREGDGDRDLDCDLVREVDRFGVCGIGMTGGGLTSGTVATGSSSQLSGVSVCNEDVSSS